jgi:DNA-binding SARP family transcriptional activator
METAETTRNESPTPNEDCRFQILAPLSISDGRDTVVLPPSKPTVLLAALLLNPNDVVSTGFLQRAIWGDDLPATAKAALQSCVLRLRRIFAKHGMANDIIENVPGGYRMSAGPQTLDLIQFRDLLGAAAAESEPLAELSTLTEAVSLWQGPLLANVPSEVLHRDVLPRLVEDLLRVTERICEIKIAAGRSRLVLPELWTATRSHPGHERFGAQLVEALYRTGRQGEALAEYRRIKDHLLNELGVDPGPVLRRLELAILRGDDLPDLESAGAGGSNPERARAASGAGIEQARPGSTNRRAPSAVPAVSCFTGREAVASSIVARLIANRPDPTIVVLSGAPGIGKTALALHVTNLVRAEFTGGQFLVRMSRPDGTPRGSAEIVAELAGVMARVSARRETGTAPVDGPAPRALLVLDDVTTPEQARELLPAGSGNAVIITSRMSLAGFVATHGGWVFRLDTFTEDESYRLLATVLGSARVAADAAAARRLCAACGHFPLALRIVAARLLTRPRTSIADCVDWLQEDPVARLSLAGDPGMSVRAVFGEYLGRLAPAIAEAFLRIGSSAEHRLSLTGCAALLETAPDVAEELVEYLVDASLLEERPGHYVPHHLLRMFARDFTDQRSTAVGPR